MIDFADLAGRRQHVALTDAILEAVNRAQATIEFTLDGQSVDANANDELSEIVGQSLGRPIWRPGPGHRHGDMPPIDTVN